MTMVFRRRLRTCLEVIFIQFIKVNDDRKVFSLPEKKKDI